MVLTMGATLTTGVVHSFPRNKKFATLPVHLIHPKMAKKPNKKTFRLNALIDGHIISGTVALSPAPQPGIFTELARFEAERVLAHAVREAIAAGQL